MIKAYKPMRIDLLPMQICATSADGFTSWIRERAIDLNVVQHRNLVSDLLGSRDKVHLALMTHMSVSYTHLDVYKRQLLHQAAQFFHLFL